MPNALPGAERPDETLNTRSASTSVLAWDRSPTRSLPHGHPVWYLRRGTRAVAAIRLVEEIRRTGRHGQHTEVIRRRWRWEGPRHEDGSGSWADTLEAALAPLGEDLDMPGLPRSLAAHAYQQLRSSNGQ